MANDLRRFTADLAVYAELAGVTGDPAKVAELLGVFADSYAGQKLAVRTTTEPPGRRDVNFRTFPIREDPLPRLRAAGLLAAAPVGPAELYEEALSAFPAAFGLDAAVTHGFEKIWAFLDEPAPLERVLRLPHLPASARDCAQQLAAHRMDRVTILGFDFWNHSVNLYSPILRPGELTPRNVAALIAALGLPVPQEEELRYDARAFQFYCTFRWDTPGVQRLCFVMAAEAAGCPVHWHPLFARFVQRAPFAAERPVFLFNTTYGPRGGYLKMETCYTDGAIGLGPDS